MTRGRLFVVAALVAAPVLACSSFGSTPSSTPDDAGTSDAGVTPDAAEAGFCASHPKVGAGEHFCRDFDDGNAAEFGWDETAIAAPAGSFGLSSMAVSPPSSLVTRMGPNSIQCSYAHATHRNATTAARIHLGFDVRLGGEGTVAGDRATYLVLGLGVAGDVSSSCQLIFIGSDNNGTVQEQYPSLDDLHELTTFPRAGTWSHVEVDVDRTSRALVVTVDGKPGFDVGITLHPECVAFDRPFVNAGFHCESTGATPREVRLDNILLTTEP